MALTDITADVLKARVRDALQKRAANVTDRNGWRLRIADKLEMNPDTFKSYLYGETCPSWEAGLRLCMFFGADFKNEIEEPAGFISARTEEEAAARVFTALALKDIRRVAPVLRAAADEIEERAGKLRPSVVRETG